MFYFLKGTQSEWANVFYTAAALYLFGAVIYLIFGTSQRQPWAHFDPLPTKESDEPNTASRDPKCQSLSDLHQEESVIQWSG